MKNNKNGSSVLAMMLSFVALLFAALVSIFNINLWLAGTQWILISILLAIYGDFMRGCGCECCEKEGEKKEI